MEDDSATGEVMQNKPFHIVWAQRLLKADTLYMRDKDLWRKYVLNLIIELLAQKKDMVELQKIDEYKNLPEEELITNLHTLRTDLGLTHDALYSTESKFGKVVSRWQKK